MEEGLIVCALRSKSLLDSINEKDFELLSSQACQIISCLREKKEIPSELSELFNYLALKADIDKEEDEEDIEEEWLNCLKEIKSLVIKEKLDKISEDIKTAELDKDSEKSKKLIEEFSNLAKQLNEEEKS